MSILIKGLKMPKDCSECQFCEWKDGNDVGCVATGKGADDCPLIELPDHGDLVDAQMLDADFRKMMERAMKKAEAEGCEEESYFVGRASAFVDARRLLNDWKRAVVIPAEMSEDETD